MIIITDTREQLPLRFNNIKSVDDVKRKTLCVGDYSIEGYEYRISFDRKSPADLVSTLTSGHDRFLREIARAKHYDYFAIIVETQFRNIRDKEYNGSYHSSVRGDIIISIVMTLKLKYGIDVIFASDREEATSIILHTFKAFLRLEQKKWHSYRSSIKDHSLDSGNESDLAEEL